MTLLIIGLFIWCVGHLVPGIKPQLRANLITRIGEGPYKGLYSLSMLLAVILIVFGWRATGSMPAYDVPAGGKHAAMIIILLAFILMAAARAKTNLKRVIRHPQLTGFALWGVGHLLANGDTRSLVLFGTMTVWAIAEILVINKREGPRETPASAPIKSDLVLVASGLVVFAIFGFLHPYFTGVSPFSA